MELVLVLVVEQCQRCHMIRNELCELARERGRLNELASSAPSAPSARQQASLVSPFFALSLPIGTLFQIPRQGANPILNPFEGLPVGGLASYYM